MLLNVVLMLRVDVPRLVAVMLVPVALVLVVGLTHLLGYLL